MSEFDSYENSFTEMVTDMRICRRSILMNETMPTDKHGIKRCEVCRLYNALMREKNNLTNTRNRHNGADSQLSPKMFARSAQIPQRNE